MAKVFETVDEDFFVHSTCFGFSEAQQKHYYIPEDGAQVNEPSPPVTVSASEDNAKAIMADRSRLRRALLFGRAKPARTPITPAWQEKIVHEMLSLETFQMDDRYNAPRSAARQASPPPHLEDLEAVRFKHNDESSALAKVCSVTGVSSPESNSNLGSLYSELPEPDFEEAVLKYHKQMTESVEEQVPDSTAIPEKVVEIEPSESAQPRKAERAVKRKFSRICSSPGCLSQSKKSKIGTLFCTSHGGGFRCATPNCHGTAAFGASVCIRHGGGNKCVVKKCETCRRAPTSFCCRHRNLFARFEFLFAAEDYSDNKNIIGVSLNAFGLEKTKARSKVYKLIDERFNKLNRTERARKLEEFAHFERACK